MKGAGKEEGAGDSPAMVATLRKLWFLCVLSATIEVWSNLEGGVFAPFLYSRVACCSPGGEGLPVKYDIVGSEKIDEYLAAIDAAGLQLPVPRGAERIPACSVPSFPNQHELWSMSNDCVNPMYVQDAAQGIIGVISPVLKILTLLVLPVGGAIADNIGRRPVLLAYVAMAVLSCVIYLVDSKLCHVWGNTMLFVAGAFLCPCWEPKASIVNASVADLMGSSQKAKAQGMMVVFVCWAAGSLAGFVLAFVCLTYHLGSYFYLWIVYSGMALGILVFVGLAVPETLPPDVKPNDFHAYEVAKVFRAQYQTFRTMCRDRLLVCLIAGNVLCWSHFAGFCTQAYPYKINAGFSQEEAIATSICCTGIQVLFALCLGKLGGGAGTIHLYLAGQFFMTCAYVAMGPLMPVLGHAAPYVGDCCIGIAIPLIGPTSAATISDRVAPEHQARAQASVMWTTSIGTLVAPMIWSLVLFDATAHGIRLLLPVYVSMILSVLCFFIAMLMAWKCDSWPKAKDLCKDGCSLPLLAEGELAGSYKAA